MSTKIMVPLDGSSLALESLPLALNLTRLTDGQLCLVRVVLPVNENFLWDWSGKAPIRQKETAESYLENMVKKLTGPANGGLAEGQVYPLVVESHSPGQAIAEAAHRQGAAYIIMTTHGRSGVGKLVLGSAANDVIRHTDLPVIFLSPAQTQPPEQYEAGAPFKPAAKLAGPVVVALDGSVEAELSLDAALELARQLHLPVHLLRVIPPFIPVDQLAGWYEANLNRGLDYLQEHDFEQLKVEATDYLIKLAGRINLPLFNGQVALRIGDPVSEIIEYARATKAALVVMATHPHGRLEHALLGTTASHVLGQGHFPVLMVNLALAKSPAEPAAKV